MGKNGSLLLKEEVTHSYPHCWRCKKPVIFRATEQWFISMEHEKLREKALEEVEKVSWVPAWGKERIEGMIKNRPDWCISRQRAWGVPITVFTCTDCGSILRDPGLLDGTVRLITEKGADAWYTADADALLPEGAKCAECGGGKFRKETDILDVWFDSGVSHAATLTGERGLSWPADMYLEGSDQYRGWFQSSMLASVGSRGSAPYRTVLTHGFVVDGKGKKMSKSIGNVIAPQDIIKTKGAEMLRLWVSAEDYRGDIRISNEIMARLTEAYRKIRNTAKFLLGNLHDFDGGDHSGDLLEIDRWAMSRLQGLIEKITDAYERFNFHEVYHRLYNFCVVDMSSFYLDILKDRLYTFRAESPERRAAQWVLNEILENMTKLMAPVLSFTAEEVWGFIRDGRDESVFLSDFLEAREEFREPELEKKWERLIAVRDEVNKALEIKRAEKFIGNSLEARVTVYPIDENDFTLLETYHGFLNTLFIVSQAELSSEGVKLVKEADSLEEAIKILEEQGTVAPWMLESFQGEYVWVHVQRAEGEKCQRCWNWSTTVGEAEDAPDICLRCHNIVK
jgi:isoleucyl-tRNA synthetase